MVSCLVKVAVQLEFGKHAINTGEPTLEALNRLPGPRWRGTSWSIWMWLGIKIVQFIQYGGMIGGVALALNIAVPSVNVWVWTCIAGFATAVLVFRGNYRFIEWFAIILVSAFSIFTLFCVFVLQTTPYQINLNDLAEGLKFHIPATAIGVALAAFGITGVSADEIISFPYWCLEKGYARFTGPRESSPRSGISSPEENLNRSTAKKDRNMIFRLKVDSPARRSSNSMGTSLNVKPRDFAATRTSCTISGPVARIASHGIDSSTLREKRRYPEVGSRRFRPRTD